MQRRSLPKPVTRLMCSLAVQGHASTWFKHVLPAAYFALGTVGSMLTTPNSGCQS